MADALKVVTSSREVIEQRLLTALSDDSGQVAILATEDDLKMLIRALDSTSDHLRITNFAPQHPEAVKMRQWSGDLEKLRRASFGEGEANDH